MFKWKIRGGPSSYGGCSRAANDGAGVTIQLLKITHFNNNTINVNKVGRHLMRLELFVARDSNLRDDQIENLKNTISRVDINLTTFKIRHEAQQEKLETYLGD